jgi:hypothetical protein
VGRKPPSENPDNYSEFTYQAEFIDDDNNKYYLNVGRLLVKNGLKANFMQRVQTDIILLQLNENMGEKIK